MKICFVWVEKFRNFTDLGINLSSEIKFEYNSKNNALNYDEVIPLPDDFFGERICEVTGIIGKNGSGKSNALELICKALKGGKSDVGYDFFIITKENNQLKCYFHFRELKMINHANNLDIVFEEYPNKINPLKVIFFSNVFDDRRNDFNTEIADISVNNLHNRKFNVARNKKLSDFEKQINFIGSKHFQILETNVPNKILISLKLWNNRLNFASQRFTYRDNQEKMNKIRSFFRSRLRELTDQNRLIQAIKYGFFLDIYEKISRDYSRKGEFRDILLNQFDTFIESISINGYTDEITDEFIYFIENRMDSLIIENQFDLFEFYNEDEHSYSNNQKKPLISEQLEFIKNIKNHFSLISLIVTNDKSRNRTSENFIIDYDNKNSIRIINEFIRLFESSNYIDVNWLGISSGHKAYLNLFSSIYDEVRYLKTQNLLICIDEGDLYLHPKWQIEFFDKLITVLPNVFSGNIQLILTSHSPFLLSDLPKQNITILDEGLINSTSNGIDLTINTFGGNLYDLYSEPFFLGDKRTSDFAYNKIKSLIEKVESRTYNKVEKIELLKLTNIIGDEIIQYRVKKTLDND